MDAKNKHVKKLAIAGIFVALGVVCSPFHIPIGASKCFPIQHMVNVLAAVLLGPFYGVGMAFVTSFLRILMGTGTLLAFPGSMCGAFLCGIAYKYSKNLYLAYAGEIIGTAVIGGLIAYPVAAILMGKEVALFFYVLPFAVSTIGGTAIAALLIAVFRKLKVLDSLRT